METSLENRSDLSSDLTTGCEQQERVIPFSQSVSSQSVSSETCPCCSDALLRPVRLDEIYWRCSCRYRDTSI